MGATNSFRMPPQSNDEAEYRAFNKRFYEDFKKKTKQARGGGGGGGGGGAMPPTREHSQPGGGGPAGAPGGVGRGGGAAPSGPPPGAPTGGGPASNGGRPQAPVKPKNLRATSRTDTSVTLDWGGASTSAEKEKEGST